MQRVFRPLVSLRASRHAATSSGLSTGSSVPESPLVKELREGMKSAMRNRDLERSNTFKSVLGDISTDSHAKTQSDPKKTLKKAIATRIDARVKCAQTRDLTAQYTREIATLAGYLEEGERNAMKEAEEQAGASTVGLADLIRELSAKHLAQLDKDLIVAISKSALASRHA